HLPCSAERLRYARGALLPPDRADSAHTALSTSCQLLNISTVQSRADQSPCPRWGCFQHYLKIRVSRIPSFRSNIPVCATSFHWPRNHSATGIEIPFFLRVKTSLGSTRSSALLKMYFPRPLFNFSRDGICAISSISL